MQQFKTVNQLAREVAKSIPSCRPLWDDEDPWLIKGLALAGEGSFMWKAATKHNPECCDKAKALLRTGWEPASHDMPEVKTYEDPF